MRATGTFSTWMSGWFANRLWFTPWPVEESQAALRRQAEWLAKTRPLVLPVSGRHLAGFVAGEGPTVLLVHGWGERAATMAGFVRPLVATGHRVVGVDLPGHGDSPDGPTDLYWFSSVLRSVADHLGGLEAVISHSMGALATTVALRDGLEVRAAALIAPAVRLEHALERFTNLSRVHPKAVTGLQARIERRFGPEVWQETAGDAIAKSLQVPALMVHDESDTQVAVEDAITLAAAWPGARLVTTQGLGHVRIVRDPDVVDQTVSFLRSPGGEPAAAQSESFSGGTA